MWHGGLGKLKQHPVLSEACHTMAQVGKQPAFRITLGCRSVGYREPLLVTLSCHKLTCGLLFGWAALGWRSMYCLKLAPVGWGK